LEGDIKMTKIPSDEDFAKADRYMEKLDRNIKQVNKNVLLYFREICPMHAHNFYLIAEEETKFRAYIFYKTNKDIQLCKDKGIDRKIEDFIYEELKRQGRGSKGIIKVAFEFDSDENVSENYEGDYFLRLH
jgi:hypothetical protein